MVTRCCPVSLSTRTQNSSVGAFTKLGRRHCLSQTNAFGRLWGPTGSVINRINYSVKTVEPNDYNTQKKTCGYDMLVGSGWFNSAGYNMIQLQSKIIKLMEVLSMAEGLRVCAWAHNPTLQHMPHSRVSLQSSRFVLFKEQSWILGGKTLNS